MTTVTCDTREAVLNLQAAGFSDAQVDAMVDIVAEAFIYTAATKAEIDRLEGRVFRALWIQGAGIVCLVVGLTKLL